MTVFCLFVTFRDGYVHVETFATAFDRALAVIQRAGDPVVLRIQDYV